ncbi:hypothetical protein JW930_02125 [Candidatus Woesearchaeota archaeon]|nr:hypothetical protein [Candidatus Woesearchaeota archaeon]
MDGHMFFYRPNFLIETIYSMIVTFSVLLVFLKTREMHKLTDHKGIKYFSLTFLFFTIAHFFRFFFRIFFRSFLTGPGPFMPGRPPFRIGELVFIYASVMAGLFMFYSVMWKKTKINEKIVILLFNILAFLTVVSDLLFRDPFVHISIITLLFAATVFMSLLLQKKSKKKHSFFVAYILVLLIWILNLVPIEMPRFLFGLRVFIYIISAALYLLLVWRILKNGKKKR